MTYDFGGYATKHNVRCSDGRVIMPDAFKDCDGMTVPLVWQHVHDSTDNVLGHALLENRSDGVYAYCSLNGTSAGQNAKEIVKHGDVCALSIYANRLQQVGESVMHGIIREVSLVLAGANPGATIDNLAFSHSDGTRTIVEDEACISFVDENSTVEYGDTLEHADNEEDLGDDPTIGEVIDTMTDIQKQAVYALVEAIRAEKNDGSSKEEPEDEKSKKEPAEEEASIKHADAEDEEDEGNDVKEEVKEAAESESEPGMSDEELKKIVDAFDDEQLAAIRAILKAVSDDTEVDEKTADVFEKFTKEQKEAVYMLVDKPDMVLKHADEDESSDETIGDIFNTFTKEEKAAYDEIVEALASDDGRKVSEESKKIFEAMTDKKKNAAYAVVGLALENAEAENEAKHFDTEGETMKYNIFDAETNETAVLSHSDMEAIFVDAPRMGSLREAVLEHGITDIEVLFPEAQAVNNQPYMLQRRMEWVSTVLNGVHKSPFARIKSTAANLTEAQARAKGYVKGRRKIEEQIVALRRVTTPQTVYKLQKLDRDDIIDITDFDVVAWMKQEMRMMLDEELARAILVGDGRGASDPEKILEAHIRSVWKDDEMYTIHKVVPTNKATDYDYIIDDIVRSRKGYKGSGNPIMFIGPDILTEMRLLKDEGGRFRYDSDAKLAEALRVSKIEEVELFDDLTRTVEGKDRKLVAIILNLADYTVGANKGGEVNLFDDFDLDYNKMEYLIETRVSGALTAPKSAIAIEIQTTTDSTPDPTYHRVTSPVVDDIADYYEQDEYGRYFQTTDVAVDSSKVYYEVDE